MPREAHPSWEPPSSDNRPATSTPIVRPSTIFNDDMYVSFFMKNVTNERGTTGAFLNEAFGPNPSQGFYGSNSREFYALPRTVGFSISRGF